MQQSHKYVEFCPKNKLDKIDHLVKTNSSANELINGYGPYVNTTRCL